MNDTARESTPPEVMQQVLQMQRQLSRLRWLVGILLLLVLAGGGWLVAERLKAPEPVEVIEEEPVVSTLRGTDLELVDADDNVYLRIGELRDRSKALVFLDEEGRESWILRVWPGGFPSLSMLDHTGATRLLMDLVPPMSGARVQLKEAGGGIAFKAP